ncbi:MAG TPA: sugar phosphate nucleotidyltransferase [Candidatus Polarisedimenticolia bacterium]|jgi:mannose-1-phosphate guanylyltransferase
MNLDAFHVIMAGGSGTRFWPVSRAARPKQFLTIAGDKPLIRQAWDRAVSMSGPGNVFVAAGRAQREMVLAALPDLDPARFIGEPSARNTAPCIGLAALRLRRLEPDRVMVAAPADHLYKRPESLAAAIEEAARAARGSGALVTLGIRPTRPETSFGYIEVEPGRPAGPPSGARRALRFVEKPDAATARGWVADGRHLWNSGVFIWKIGAILEALEKSVPDLWRGMLEIERALGGPGEDDVVARVFENLAPCSIDYAVMEKAREVLVVEVDPGWSDVGSWDAVAELQDTDAAGNSVLSIAAGETLTLGSRDTFIYSGSDRFIAVAGVEDLVIVDGPDALLICRRGESQSVRAVVEALKARGRNDLL